MSLYANRFADRFAVITGGASGVGFTTAQRMIAEGGTVSLWDVNTAALAAAQDRLGASCHTVDVDVSHWDSVARAAESLAPLALPRPILVDCSHGNSHKDPRRQPAVFRAVLAQFSEPGAPILGAMLESHLREGRQELVSGSALEPGVSVTDACLGWDETEAMLREAAGRLR